MKERLKEYNDLIKPRSVMMYGISGSTKTSQLYNMAKMLVKMNPGKRVRMIHCDGGGYAPFVDSGMVERGEVEVFEYSNRQYALSDFRKLSEGYWPIWVKGSQYFSKWEEGTTEYFQPEEICRTRDWENIIAYFIEGMTSVGETLKSHCSNQTTGVGFKEAWKYEEESYTITGLTPGHYDIVQKELYDRHNRGFKNLPIPWLFWTALVGKGEDKQNRETVYGPQIVGNATTPKVPTWVMDCLHLSREKYTVIPTKLEMNPANKGVEVEGMVAWFVNHPDSQTGVPYLCKPRVMPEVYPKLLEYFPYGFVPLDYKHGIQLYFAVLEKLKKEERKG